MHPLPGPKCIPGGDVGGGDPLVAVGPEPPVDVDRLKGRGVTALHPARLLVKGLQILNCLFIILTLFPSQQPERLGFLNAIFRFEVCWFQKHSIQMSIYKKKTCMKS